MMNRQEIKYRIKCFLKALYNVFFCLKYPFYRFIDRQTEKPKIFSDYTWYDSIDSGWKKAFGKQLSRDLRKALIKDKDLYTFRFCDIKEKYGYLVLDAFSYGPNTEKVINYYENLSICYCYFCGKPSRYITAGWIEYVCKECAEKKIYGSKYHPLTEENIPKIHRYKDGEWIEEKLDIDYYSMWGLNEKDSNNS